MRTLNAYESLKEMIAVGHDGTKYFLKIGKRLPDKELVKLLSDFPQDMEKLNFLVKNYKWKYTPFRKV